MHEWALAGGIIRTALEAGRDTGRFAERLM